jgi:alpha-L-fucosidase
MSTHCTGGVNCCKAHLQRIWPRAQARQASNTRGNDPQFAPAHVLDSRRDTYWSTDDEELTPQLVLDLVQPATFNVVRLREYLPLGQRVDSFALRRLG